MSLDKLPYNWISIGGGYPPGPEYNALYEMAKERTDPEKGASPVPEEPESLVRAIFWFAQRPKDTKKNVRAVRTLFCTAAQPAHPSIRGSASRPAPPLNLFSPLRYHFRAPRSG